jgi:hypothetical protein
VAIWNSCTASRGRLDSGPPTASSLLSAVDHDVAAAAELPRRRDGDAVGLGGIEVPDRRVAGHEEAQLEELSGEGRFLDGPRADHVLHRGAVRRQRRRLGLDGHLLLPALHPRAAARSRRGPLRAARARTCATPGPRPPRSRNTPGARWVRTKPPRVSENALAGAPWLGRTTRTVAPATAAPVVSVTVPAASPSRGPGPGHRREGDAGPRAFLPTAGAIPILPGFTGPLSPGAIRVHPENLHAAAATRRDIARARVYGVRAGRIISREQSGRIVPMRRGRRGGRLQPTTNVARCRPRR